MPKKRAVVLVGDEIWRKLRSKEHAHDCPCKVCVPEEPHSNECDCADCVEEDYKASQPDSPEIRKLVAEYARLAEKQNEADTRAEEIEIDRLAGIVLKRLEKLGFDTETIIDSGS